MKDGVQIPPVCETVEVERNERIAEDVYALGLRAPRIAATIAGGQFIHLRINAGETLLRRPLSVCQVKGDTLEILYAVVGTGTALLTGKSAGDTSMDAIGPLGACWPVDDTIQAPLLVGGGLGIAPLGMLAHYFRDHSIPVTVIQGALNERRLVTKDVHEGVSRDIRFATDDGSFGYHGFVTGLVSEAIASTTYDTVYVCGPEPMQKAVSDLTLAAGIETYVSFERRMACGVGACLGCVLPTTAGVKRACVDGPVFNAKEVLFDDAIASRVN